MEAPKYVIMILAAGESRRLKRPKQLVSIDGIPLIRFITKIALQSEAKDVYVVLGADYELVQSEIIDLPVNILVNPTWQQGMGASLSFGFNTLADKVVSGILVLLCDQLLVTIDMINHYFFLAKQNPTKIIASSYAGKIGVPALFHQDLFDILRSLQGDKGAKSLLGKSKDKLITVPFEDGVYDIDTEEQYQAALKRFREIRNDKPHN